MDWNETTADGRFTLKEGECFGACGDAPVVLVNNKTMLIGMTPKKLDTWLDGGGQMMPSSIAPFAPGRVRSRRDHPQGLDRH